MKLPLPRRRIFRAPIYLISLALVLAAADLILVQIRREIRPGFDTTRIISPTLPDGSVDYLLAYDQTNGQGVTAQNNAAIPIFEALGRAALPKNQPADGITDRLGMPHLPEEGDYYVTYDNYCRDHSTDSEDDPFEPSAQLHWPMSFKPVTAQWINANEKPLALLAEASKRTRFFIPFYGGNRPDVMEDTLLPYLGLLRNATRCLLTRAVIRLQAGDTTGFQEDVFTVHRLARRLIQADTMIDQLVAWGPLESCACRVDRLAAASGKLSAAELRSLSGQLAALGEVPSYFHCIDEGERFMTLDCMQTIAVAPAARRARVANLVCSGFDRPPGIPDIAVRFWPIPCEAAMRELNHFCDGMLVAAQQPTYPQRIAAFNLWDDDVAKVKQHNSIWWYVSADLPVAAILLSPIKVEQNYESTRMERRLTLIAIELTAYKSDHGTYPASLGEISSDTNDLFVDRPVIYAPRDKKYVLYSVGPNMKDDGGGTGAGDDIVASVP